MKLSFLSRLRLVAPGLALALGACGQTDDQPQFEPASADTLQGDRRAFRSSLDNRARMLTLRQDDDVHLAYDAEHGYLYQAWEGDIHFSGAVYDTRHGPQPRSEGALYYTDEDARWQAERARVRYRGHRYSGDTVALHYEVIGEGWQADIWEKPSTELDGEQLTVHREFAVTGLPKGLSVTLADMTEAPDQSLVGAGEWQREGALTLKEGVTRLSQTFTEPTPIKSYEEDEDKPTGLALIEGSDCASCHNAEHKTVGPSYTAMAERYENNAKNVAKLARKIIDGGSGNWGEAPMTPHPDLSIEQAAQMVQYIFTLAPEDGKAGDADAAERDDTEATERESLMPGDRAEVAGVHPAFDRFQARPEDFEPKVGGIDFLPDDRLVISTWDPEGSVYLVENYTAEEPGSIEVKRIARGLAEPLGVKVVDGDIYVMQKQELTRLVDTNGDEVTDVYETVANDWSATSNFHEFAFGLEYQEGRFYATLATAILPGGASADPQAPDRGTLMSVDPETGHVDFIARGLRTPNGIGRGVDDQLFIADNQGDWLPASKIVEVTPGAFYGSRSVDFDGLEEQEETKPVVWLPQDEIGNSPSEPAPLDVGPYDNQMIHGEVTHGGIKRVYAERVDGRLQGAVFRFTQGLEAGVNRLDWAPDGSLIVGGVGNPGNWGHQGKLDHGLQRLVYNGDTAFEMLSVSARADGFVVEFTEAIAEDDAVSADHFEIEQWYYEPTEEYGGPKKDRKTLPVRDFALSDDRKRAYFKLDGLQEDHVVYFRIAEPFRSEGDRKLWSTEAWYTLNALPDDALNLPE